MSEQRIDDIGRVGLNTDIAPSQLPANALTGMRNVRSTDGYLRPLYGKKKVFDISIRPLYHTGYKDPDGSQYLIYSDGLTVIANPVLSTPAMQSAPEPMLAGNEIDITPADSLANGLLTFTVLNGILIVNSSLAGPFYWPGGTLQLEPLPGWQSDWTCQQMVAFREHLVALRMREGGVEYPHKYRGSTSAGPGEVPTEWLPAPDNLAFTGLLPDTMGGIVGGITIKDRLWVVKEDSVCFLDWVGGDYIVVPSRSIGNIGTQIINGFEEINGALVLLSTSDLLLFDGVNITSLVDDKVRNALQTNIAQERWDLAQLHVAENRGLLIVQGSTGGADRLNAALMLDLSEGVWSVTSLNNCYGMDNALVVFTDTVISPANDTWDADTLPWNNADWVELIWQKSVYAPSTPVLVHYESNDDDTAWWVAAVVPLTYSNVNGDPQYCLIERTGIPFEGTPGMAVITEVWADLYHTVPIHLTIGTQLVADGEIRWGFPRVIYPNDRPVIRPRARGRYICWRAETNSAGAWRLASITFKWQKDGER